MGDDLVVVNTGGGGDGWSFFGLLIIVTLVLAIFKVNGNLEMSWLLVTLPVWIGFLVAFVVMVVFMFVEVIKIAIGGKK